MFTIYYSCLHFFTISFLNLSLFRASFADNFLHILGNVFWYIPVLKFLILRSLMGKKVHFVHKTHENFFMTQFEALY